MEKWYILSSCERVLLYDIVCTCQDQASCLLDLQLTSLWLPNDDDYLRNWILTCKPVWVLEKVVDDKNNIAVIIFMYSTVQK